MSGLTVALWGCGRIGREAASHLAAAGHTIVWCRDSDPARAGMLAQELGASFLPEEPKAPHHPMVDVIVDATGDRRLMEYWRRVLKWGRARHVILTRREPEADLQVMAGLPEGIPPIPAGTMTAMGSCTGNAWVTFAAHLLKRFDVEAMACRVLHPLKQYEIRDLRVISTALWYSFRDHRPEQAERFSAYSMEIPVDRGMALDFSVVFAQDISRDELEAHFREVVGSHPHMFGLAEEEPTSASIVGDPRSWVLGPTWTLNHRLLRGLLWQDNEGGYAARIVDVVNALES